MDHIKLYLALCTALIGLLHDFVTTSNAITNQCNVSQFKCANGTCILLSKFCDGVSDCIDGSDEPARCTACNRTLYGENGKTYEIEIRKPKLFPFICQLNFTAAGGSYGDIIQINIDKFNVGRFLSHMNNGCADGFMTISEKGLPDMGGQWCGSAWGYNVYYSETSSINISLKIWRIIQQQSHIENYFFKLTYKFLKRADAKIRTEDGIWTGDHVPDTYCSKNIYDCDRRVCRIRSPNFPGMYPRNLTCKYHVHHRPPPTGLHAMLIIRQPVRQKMNIKDQERSHEPNSRAIRAWSQCDSVQDYLSVYDGRTVGFPQLARICGGEYLPDIISSGSDMLIIFQSSPYDSLYHPVPIAFLHGFEMEIKVMFVSSNSQLYTRQPSFCEFTLSAFESASGELESPKHTLPQNTVCRYHFQGRRHEIVWISFIKYHSAVDQSLFESPSECQPQLRIWDGKLGSTLNKHDISHDIIRNASLLAEICREEVPKLCSRSLIIKDSRPCSAQESYLSSSADLTIEYLPNPAGTTRMYGPSSAFRLRYEFVDTSQGGSPLDKNLRSKTMPEPAALLHVQSKSCDRIYRSLTASRGIFRSSSNVFMFGRGGASNLSCTIRFEANPDEIVRITITRARFGGRACQNIQNRSGRWHCNNLGGAESMLRIGEVPWPDIPPLPRDCICSDISGSLALTPMEAHVVEAHFTTLDMDIDQDFRDFYFEGRYEFVKDNCDIKWEQRRLKGISGESFLRPSTCTPLIQSWLLETETDNGYLVLMMKGFWMPTVLHSVPPCPTDARITVFSTNNPNESRDLCPSGTDVVAYSDGWDNFNKFNPVALSKNLIIEFRSPWRKSIEASEYRISWMEVFPDVDCIYRCTELQACISPQLWCDGNIHCPSGQDEDPLECYAPPPLSPLQVGFAAAALTICLSLAAGLAACVRRKRVEKSSNYSSHHLDINGVAYGSRPIPHHSLPSLYLDAQPKDSFC